MIRAARQIERVDGVALASRWSPDRRVTVRRTACLEAGVSVARVPPAAGLARDPVSDRRTPIQHVFRRGLR